MAGESITYRKLRKYKYQTVEPSSIQLATIRPPGGDVKLEGGWVRVSADGLFSLKQGYAWDGPSDRAAGHLRDPVIGGLSASPAAAQRARAADGAVGGEHRP
jgi:hypothetical protein